MTTCVVEGCDSEAGTGRGMCHKHYKRWQKHGHTGLTTGKACTDPWERFRFLTKRADSGCLEWQGPIGRRGYGQTKWKYKFYSAHRFSWVLHFGEVPEGLIVCHKCDNRICVDPEHLFVGTHKDNAMDRDRKGRDRWSRQASRRAGSM